ncbi:MAG: M14 family zinc carboxypeptidase [Actinomycetota bacterium]
MAQRRSLAALTAGVMVAVLLSAPPAVLGAACPEEPTYLADVPDPIISLPGFPDRRATTTELIDYSEAVDDASDRVTTGTFATSWNGTPLVYSLVASKSNLAGIENVVRKQQALRDARRTNAPEARRIARSSPAIVWYTGNVHGNETSGADAAIQILYELAARTDCAVKDILDEVVVGIIPTQNPDGRDAFSRTNVYGFDMNRDWFARTQPETDGKLDLLAKYPPVLFIDAHEMGSSDFFFPPNADPIHHEIASEAVHWINDIYGKAMAKEFEQRQQSDPANWDYFNYSIYDLFYMGYGDTVPTTAFTSAGMTFEKGTADSDRQRWAEQFAAGWTSITAAAEHKNAILTDYYNAHADALAQGRKGKLEPNEILQPENKLKRRVPNLKVRHYFVPADRAWSDVALLINRLRKMDVEVYRLTRRLEVPDLQPYGKHGRRATVSKGSYWIPMAQPQKHWIQALMGEDPYTPFPYFYDVTAWSNPLLLNLGATFSGAELKVPAERVTRALRGRVLGPAGRAKSFWWPGDSGAAIAAALALARNDVDVGRLARSTTSGDKSLPRGAFVVSGNAAAQVKKKARRFDLRAHASTRALSTGRGFEQPAIALYSSAAGGESLGHMRYLLEHVWKVPYDPLTGAEVAAGALTTGDYDAFLVPGVNTADLNSATAQIQTWIEGGGTYVGTARPGGSGGTAFAVAQGFTSAQESEPARLQVPGTMFRVKVNSKSPVTLGAPRTAYWYHLGERVLARSDTGVNAVTFPKEKQWFSGYAEGESTLGKSAALIDEKLGSGHVVLFSGEPNYRAYTEGVSFFLANALTYPKKATSATTDLASRSAAPMVARAMASASPPIGPGRPVGIVVPASQSDDALRVLQKFDAHFSVRVLGGRAYLRVPNPQGLDFESHPYIWRLMPALRAAGVTVHSAIF